MASPKIVTITFLILIIISETHFLRAQSSKKFLKGYVYEVASKEALIGAVVALPEYKTGTQTNAYGFFSIDVTAYPQGLAVVSYIGYETYTFAYTPTDTLLTIYLKPQNRILNEVVVKGDSAQTTFYQTAGMITLQPGEIKRTPQLMGEVDVLRTLQLMPGIKGANEGQAGIYVRGGGPDQNLLILDGVPIYNASHLFGFFSVFNADAIQNISVYKSGFPARYGGRLSSVIDITQKDGNKEKWHGEGQIGLIAAKMMVEGPIKKNKTSILVAGRRTYLDILAAPLLGAATAGSARAGYYFYDANLKINHRINAKNSITFSSYIGNDRFYINFREPGFSTNAFRSNLGWGNAVAVLKWQNIPRPNLFSITAISYNRYHFGVGSFTYNNAVSAFNYGRETYRAVYNSGIEDVSLSHEYEHTLSNRHLLRYGVKGIFHRFNAGALQYKINENTNPENNIDTTIGKTTSGTETYAYIEHEWNINNRLKLANGLHWNHFISGSAYYQLPQPRITGRFLITPTLNWRGAYTYMMQSIHLLSNNSIGLPTDLWVPSTHRIKPQQSWQVSTGFSKYVYNRVFELSFEAYYKHMQNTIDYLDGASFIAPGTDWQNEVAQGKGWAYGAEYMIQKKSGKTTGWVGYTLSWAYRQYDEINFGRAFPYRFDRRHDISTVIQHQLSPKWEVGFTWVFNTGNALTLQQSEYSGLSMPNVNSWLDGSRIEYYDARNSFRMPNYHRADISFTYRKQQKKYEKRWNFSVYNLYARANPFFLAFNTDQNGNQRLYGYPLFLFLPSAAYGIKF